MECVEARALKSSFSSELATKATNPQSIIDDFWCMAGLPSDDFSIDEFFDLPNEDEQQQQQQQQQEHEEHEDNIDGSSFLEEEEEKDSSFSLSSHEAIDDSNSNSTNFSPDLLSIPVDDVQELELWSHLMDDSIPESTLACPNPILDGQKMKTGFSFMNRVEPVVKPVSAHPRVPPFKPSAVPVKPRTKRSRSIGNRSWGIASPESTSNLLFDMAPPRISDLGMLLAFGKPTAKKPKKPKKRVDDNDVPIVQRRCSHCQVTKTPQWRAGPNGPKTLCNACGVRFKSGRLFPEYRPACSPTFSSEVHSNSHRKVLEMRKKKEGTESTVSGSMILAA